IEHTENVKSSHFEFQLQQPSYTIDTLTHLQERYPDKKFALIMGSDNLVSLKKWKNYEIILRDYEIYVYPRPGYQPDDSVVYPSVTVTPTPLMEISSTFIRKAISANKNVQFFLPDAVIDFIEKKGLYL